ncbi:class I SAM-dependent methyltransferase [Natronosalvus halobius]|uniref:class I SAM-dependent methyltransferase n=1 Tax=Natronosalvus halobius TaxID=2953746 RepID=UPI00209FA336|nr:class I SAM-dependent methyltransferase [Natronosalvus halobius]USZ71341.1 class I SAM-dependent methyltransferase [Natronosalvus halobius]
MTEEHDGKRKTAATFDAASDHYLDSDVHRHGADLERLTSWCADATRALDVATGAGHTAGAVADRGVPTVVATDAAPSMVETAVDAFGGLEGAIVDAERLPFARDAFDAVTCRIAAHHFPNPTAFVREVSRVLEPGGVLALEDNVAPADPSLGEFINRVERLRDPTHVESYTIERWHEWLREAGFALEETVRLHKPLQFESWADGQSCTGEERKRVERTLREASDEAVETFDIRVEDGRVVSFAPLKALVRARHLE